MRSWSLHGFAANHHWADHLIGPGKPLDTDKYFVICPDELGSPQTTFEHSTSPTNSGLKMTSRSTTEETGSRPSTYW